MMLKKIFFFSLFFFVTACFSSQEEELLSEADKKYRVTDYTQAEKLYQQYLKQFPLGGRRWEAWHKLLDITNIIYNRPENAIQILETMQLEFSGDPEKKEELFDDLIDVYIKMHDWKKATEILEMRLTSTGLNKENIYKIYWKLGKVYLYKRDYFSSYKAMSGCVDSAPEGSMIKAQCTYELASILSLLKRSKESKKLLEALIEEKNVHPDPELRALSLFLLADILEVEGKIERARKILLSIHDTHPNPKAVEIRLQYLSRE